MTTVTSAHAPRVNNFCSTSYATCEPTSSYNESGAQEIIAPSHLKEEPLIGTHCIELI